MPASDIEFIQKALLEERNKEPEEKIQLFENPMTTKQIDSVSPTLLRKQSK